MNNKPVRHGEVWLQPIDSMPGEHLTYYNGTAYPTTLYRVDRFLGTRDTEYCMLMHDASTDREFIEWVEPDIGKQGNADLAQASGWRYEDGTHVPLEDYLNLGQEA